MVYLPRTAHLLLHARYHIIYLTALHNRLTVNTPIAMYMKYGTNSCAISSNLSRTGVNVSVPCDKTAHVVTMFDIFVQNKRLCLQAVLLHTYFAQSYSTLHKVHNAKYFEIVKVGML